MIIQLKEHYFIFYESLIILNISIFLSNFSKGVPASVLVSQSIRNTMYKKSIKFATDVELAKLTFSDTAVVK